MFEELRQKQRLSCVKVGKLWLDELLPKGRQEGGMIGGWRRWGAKWLSKFSDALFFCHLVTTSPPSYPTLACHKLVTNPLNEIPLLTVIAVCNPLALNVPHVRSTSSYLKYHKTHCLTNVWGDLKDYETCIKWDQNVEFIFHWHVTSVIMTYYLHLCSSNTCNTPLTPKPFIK